MEIYNDSWIITVETDTKSKINFNTSTLDVFIDDLNVVYPWEYEKSGILLVVKEYNDSLFYSFTVDWTHLVIITDDKFEQKEEILSFFGDVDILIIVWSKDSAKIFENIEARLVVAYWEWKDTFLTTLWQHTQEVDRYKIKWDFSLDSTEFVNLK